MSQLSLSNLIWLYSDCIFTRLTACKSVNSFTNCSIFKEILTSLIVTLLICMAALIKRYFPFCNFWTRNHEFQYGPWHGSRMSESSRFFSMLMSSSFNALSTWNSEICHVLCDIVQIFWGRTTSDHNLLRWLKCHDNALFWLNNTVIRISHSVNVNYDLIFRFVTFSEVILMSHLMSENFKVIKWPYESRFNSCHRINVNLFLRIFSFQFITQIEHSLLRSAWSTDWTLFTLHLYAAWAWLQKTSNSESHCLDKRAHLPITEAAGQNISAILFKLWFLTVWLTVWLFCDCGKLVGSDSWVCPTSIGKFHTAAPATLELEFWYFDWQWRVTTSVLLLVSLFPSWIQPLKTNTTRIWSLSLFWQPETSLFYHCAGCWFQYSLCQTNLIVSSLMLLLDMTCQESWADSLSLQLARIAILLSGQFKSQCSCKCHEAQSLDHWCQSITNSHLLYKKHWVSEECILQQGSLLRQCQSMLILDLLQPSQLFLNWWMSKEHWITKMSKGCWCWPSQSLKSWI